MGAHNYLPTVSSNEDGGSAFPGIVERPAGGVPGMSLRDYFAAKAMQAYMSWSLDQPPNIQADSRQKAAAHYARVSYEIADAMLKERAK